MNRNSDRYKSIISALLATADSWEIWGQASIYDDYLVTPGSIVPQGDDSKEDVRGRILKRLKVK